MAAPGARMRLTVEVLPLEAENAHGPYRAQAIAAFKGRKFALPVQLEDTFERVWAQIEQRYKTNYLDAQQAAAFTIKKLQDAYDCDLDLGDTVSSIFEGEADPSMRTVKVVPSFVNRAFSVPATSNLRPGYVQKRLREVDAENANKRRRVEQLPQEHNREEVDPSRDQPIPTTESERSGDDSAGGDGPRGTLPRSRSRRSQTGGSWVVVNDAQTGQVEFGTSVKEESPELGLQPTREAPRSGSSGDSFRKQAVPASRTPPRTQQRIQSRPRTHESPRAIFEQQVGEEVSGQDDPLTQDLTIQEDIAQAEQHAAASTNPESQEAALHRSPRLTSEPSQDTTTPAAAKRKDIYEVSSSPEFLQHRSKAKSKKTYSKSPRTATTIQKEVDLLNNSRRLSARAQSNSSTQRSVPDSLSRKARTFQFPKPDEIESTPQDEQNVAASALPRGSRAESMQNDVDLTAAFLDSAARALQDSNQTPERPNSAKPGRSGSLKKPSRNALPGTPSSARRGVQFDGTQASVQRTKADSDSKSSAVSPAASTGSKGKKLDPEIQARLDKLRRPRRSSSKGVPEQPPQRISLESKAESVSDGDSSAAQIAAETAQSVIRPETLSRSEATSFEPDTNSPNNPVQLSMQPPSRFTPMKSPVPLPENVRHLTTNGRGPSLEANTSKGADVFKKPDLKLWSTKSNGRANSGSVERRGSGSSDRRSTPLRNEVLIPSTGRASVQPAAEEAGRRPSYPGESTHTPIHNGAPLPSNQRHSSRDSSMQDNPVPPVQPLVSPKRRGRPSKSASQDSSTQRDLHVVRDGSLMELVPLADALLTPKRRGRPPKHASNVSQEIAKATPRIKPATRNEAVQPVPQASSKHRSGADEAIVISSREPSTSEYTDSEDDEEQNTVSESLNGAVEKSLQTKNNGTSQLLKTTSTGNDAELPPDANKDLLRKSTADEDDLARSQSLNPSYSKDDLLKEDRPASNAIPWGKESWGFEGLVQSNGAPGTLVDDVETQSHSLLADEAMNHVITEDEADAESISEPDTKSRSASAAISTRSSPAVTRQAARFLSHSPTPEASNSEDDSEDTSTAPSKAATPPPPEGNEESESDSSSDSDESDDEDEDTEMPDVPEDSAPDSTTNKTESAVPSSPPRLPSLLNSTPLVPETSQPAPSQINPNAIHKTPVPLPPQSQLRSSQSVSAQAAARRPTARYAGFRTLREQLADAKTKPTTPQTKTYDPRTMNLGKLATKAKGGNIASVGNDDESSEDESSSSSSDSD